MPDVSRFIAKAEDAMKKRNYDYAIQMYQEALLVDPGNADARRNFRLSLVKKYDEHGYPRSLLGGLGGVKTLMLGKDPLKLIEETEKMVVKDPKNLKYNSRVASALSMLKHHDAAVAVLEYMINHCDNGKNDVATLKSLAQEYIKVKRTKDAQQVLSRAQRVAPNDKEIATLAKNIAAQGMLDTVGSVKSSYELVKNADQAAELEKKQRLVMSSDDVDSLIGLEEQKLQQNPLDRRAVRAIGELLAKKKEYNKAYERLREFLNVDPGATEIGDLAAKYKNMYFDHAIRACQHKATQEPDKAEEWRAKEQKFVEARKAFGLEEFGRQVEAAPTDLDKRFAYGQTLFDNRRYDEAFKHFQKAVKSPKHAKTVGVLMGRCLIEMGRMEMAEQQFGNVAKQLTDDDLEVRKQLNYFTADLFERRGDLQAALDSFRTLYLEDAEFMDVEQRIDRLRGQVPAPK